eukprot:TRINITY_DN66237_c0_g1_i1.p1 TRINITY_DN66237_c0_g1~~TRINITY_DN66237_c0_g1_i1.p1  ORF type:complete len:226 (+),score=58.64 TRINITY_DN66237_c0_g1_i1:70-747(+)
MAPTDEAKEEAERLWQAVAFRGFCDKGDMEQIDEMIANGANPNYKMTDGSNWNVLMLAVNGGHKELVDKFMKGGKFPKVDEKDPQGFQAIMIAALKGHAGICRTLLEKKADANARNEDGETPLMMASAEGHAEVVSILLEAGADPDAIDNNEMTAIKKASRWGRVDCLKTLLPKVNQDPRQMKHCLLFGRLYNHEEIQAEMRKILDPPEEVEAVEDATGAVAPAS